MVVSQCSEQTEHAVCPSGGLFQVPAPLACERTCIYISQGRSNPGTLGKGLRKSPGWLSPGSLGAQGWLETNIVPKDEFRSLHNFKDLKLHFLPKT